MRHVVGLLLGIVLAPAVLVGAGWGSAQLYRSYAQLNFSPDRILLPALALAGAAIVYAIVVSTRISPVTSFLIGLPFLALAVLAFVPRVLIAVTSLWRPAGDGLTTLAISGGALIIGLAGVLPIFVPSRWRRWRARPNGGAAAGSDGFGYDPDPVPASPYGGPGPLVGAGTAPEPSPYQSNQPDTLRLPGAGGPGHGAPGHGGPAHHEDTISFPPGQSPPQPPR